MNKNAIIRIKKIISSKCGRDYINALNASFKDCETLLDVGCGKNSPIQYAKNKPKYSVGIDAFEPSLKESMQKKIHNKYRLMDVMDLGDKFDKNSFDCVLANDLIEHLNKDDSEKLIKMMEGVARKKVVIFTPNGFVEQDKYDDNTWQEHLCGWSYREMLERGYEVSGMAGLKYLKGYKAKVRFKPRILWRIISELSQFLTKKLLPKYSFAIFCVKNIRNKD